MSYRASCDISTVRCSPGSSVPLLFNFAPDSPEIHVLLSVVIPVIVLVLLAIIHLIIERVRTQIILIGMHKVVEVRSAL